MAEESSKWVDAVLKLLKLTQEGQLKWDYHAIGEQRGVDQKEEYVSGAIFTTTYKGKNLQLYEERHKRPKRQSFVDAINAAALGAPEPSMVWDTRIVLEFVAENGARLWAFPDSAPLEDLLDSVQYQVAGVRGFLDDLLNESKSSGEAA